LQPTAQIRLNQLKAAISTCVIKMPTLNQSPWRANIYAGYRAERIITLLHHWRRVVREPHRWVQMAGQTDGPHLVALHKLLSITTLIPKGEKKLKKQVSNDSEGYPRVLGAKATQLT
jgi:hypothetical protein